MKRKHENFVLPFLLSFRVRLLQKGVFFVGKMGFGVVKKEIAAARFVEQVYFYKALR